MLRTGKLAAVVALVAASTAIACGGASLSTASTDAGHDVNLHLTAVLPVDAGPDVVSYPVYAPAPPKPPSPTAPTASGLNRFYGAAFTDIGSAFNAPSTADFKVGSGAELRVDFTIGFIELFTFAFGYAHGWSTDGIDKFYCVSTAQF